MSLTIVNENNTLDGQYLENLIIKIQRNVLENIKSHAERDYPKESCGIIIGNVNSSPDVIEIKRVENVNLNNANRRFNIEPVDLLKFDNEAEDKGLELIGIYHSHPDHPSIPSTEKL